jgi:F0F1-type ATP synthase membrane subunit b/b'
MSGYYSPDFLEKESDEAKREAMDQLEKYEEEIEKLKEQREWLIELYKREYERLTEELSHRASTCRRLTQFINSPVENDGV